MVKKTDSNIIDWAQRQPHTRQQLVQRLIEEHGTALRLFVRGRLVPVDDQDDIIQEVFSRLLATGNLESKMSAASGSNRAFILTMANNLIVDAERKKQVRSTYAARQQQEEEGGAYAIGPEESAAASRDLDQVKRVLMGMKPTWRKAFILNRFNYMSYREVAENMGVSVKQVESYLSQAMARLRKAGQQMGRDGGKP